MLNLFKSIFMSVRLLIQHYFLFCVGEMPESKKEAIYYSSNISEGSFYESYDPFEYMGAKAQQQKDGEDQQDAHLALQTEDLNISDG